MTRLASLRPHQQTALDGLKHSLLTGHRRPMLQAPTGFGKTVVAAHIVAGARAKGKRVAFCVPSLGLIDQTFDRFVENGIDAAEMGVLQGNHPWRRPHAPVQIATAQTLARRDLPEVDVVVIDEAHIRFSVYEAWMTDPDWQRVPFIGLSATPWARGLGRLFDDLICPTSLTALIGEGYLSPFRVFAPTHVDLTGVRTLAGDYHEGELAERMNKPKLVADIVSTWLARAGGLPTLCFATGRQHAQSIHDRFCEVGVKAAYVDADTPREEREAIGKRLAAGDVQVVCNIGTLTTGIDWDVRCIILARPTKSESLFVQIIGRGLRTADGKTECLILDHSDTHLRLGMVTDIDFEALDDGRKEAKGKPEKKHKVALPRECAACACLIPAHVATCPSCGHVMQVATVLQMPGTLAEMETATRRKPGAAPSVSDMLRAMGKASIYAQLLHEADERGRSQGWAAHTYKDLFDVWPKGLSKHHAEEPTPLLRSWLKSRAIAWAKRQQSITREATHA